MNSTNTKWTLSDDLNPPISIHNPAIQKKSPDAFDYNYSNQKRDGILDEIMHVKFSFYSTTFADFAVALYSFLIPFHGIKQT